MAKFVKKPVVIEALQFHPKLTPDIVQEVFGFNPIMYNYEGNGGFYIDTLEGKMMLKYGDYIIKGVNGEYYPCKEDIFNKTYAIIE